MASDDFVRSVISHMRHILNTEGEARRLDLTAAVVLGWRRKLDGSPAQLIHEIKSTASSNKVDLDGFEAAQADDGSPKPNRAVVAAETFLAAVDEFCRLQIGGPGGNRKLTP